MTGSRLYAESITPSAPAAEQVADRRHLLKNVVDVLKEFINQRHPEFSRARQAIINRQSGSSESVSLPFFFGFADSI